MVLVLLERKQTSGESPYALVKQAGDSALGIRTQCFAADKAGIGRNARPPKGRLQYCANVAMKINTKMGGVNVKLLDDPKQVRPAAQCWYVQGQLLIACLADDACTWTHDC
jgi:hypothetical protein